MFLREASSRSEAELETEHYRADTLEFELTSSRSLINDDVLQLQRFEGDGSESDIRTNASVTEALLPKPMQLPRVVHCLDMHTSTVESR